MINFDVSSQNGCPNPLGSITGHQAWSRQGFLVEIGLSNGGVMGCACSSQKDLEECCLPIIEGTRKASVPEELMRARYTAFTIGKLDFIESSHDPKTIADFDMEATREWAKETKWLGLEILDADEVSPQDTEGEVEFVATFRNKNGKGEHHEISTFKKRKGEWFFSEGAEQGHDPIEREEPKVGRNDPCPCGSGKKYKKCCIA